MKLTLLVPSYNDLVEALLVTDLARQDSEWVRRGEVLVFSRDPVSPRAVPEGTAVTVWPCGSGLPAVKNSGAGQASGELLLFLFPPLVPRSGAIDRLVEQMDRFPKWGAVSARWENREGRVERGYNVRRFPTFAALVFDLLFVHKLFPRNHLTGQYKMLDFDHAAIQPVDCANDCAFIVRRDLTLRVGGFNEGYRFGWFDQIEFCLALKRAGSPVVYDPGSVFVMLHREPLVNRMLADYYVNFYRDESLFVARHFGPGHALAFRALLVLGMLARIGFANLLPGVARSALIRRFRPYVSDPYIRSMRPAYLSLLKEALRLGGLA